jgi:hypothetical protein
MSVAAAHLNHVSEKMGLLQTTLPLAGVALIVFTGRIARAKARGQRCPAWKTYGRVLLSLIVLTVAWRVGALGRLSDVMCQASAESRLAVAIGMMGMLGAFIFGARKAGRVECDEISGPLLYWMTAMMIGSVATCAFWREPQTVVLQVRTLEIVAITALLVGLSSVGERRQREATEKMGDLDAMQKISWSLVGAATLNDICSAFATAISEGFGDSPVVVYLAEEGNLDLTIAAAAGMDDSTVFVGKKCSLRPERRPGFHCGHTARAFASGSVETTSDIFSDAEFMPWRAVAKHDGLVVSVPLPHKGRVVGVVNLFLSGVSTLGEGRKKLLQSVAVSVSPAIENARLQPDEQVELRLAA